MTYMRVLQYRTTYINGTPILNRPCNISSKSTLDQTLKLIDVAFVRDNDSGLEFPEHYARDDIWPGKQLFNMCTKINVSFYMQVTILMMVLKLTKHLSLFQLQCYLSFLILLA